MIKLAIILGSTRPGRHGEAVARWVHAIAAKRKDAEFELVHIQSFNLPLLDDAYDAYVFVTPEYNHGTSAALKNAIDYLYREWNNKAAGFVSYGSAGGARAHRLAA